MLRLEQWIAAVQQASQGHVLVVYGLREGAGPDQQPLTVVLGTRLSAKKLETTEGEQVELLGDLAEDRARAAGILGMYINGFRQGVPLKWHFYVDSGPSVRPPPVDLTAAYPPVASTSSAPAPSNAMPFPSILFDLRTGVLPPPETVKTQKELAQALREATNRKEAARVASRDVKGKGKAVQVAEGAELGLSVDRDEGYDENAAEEDVQMEDVVEEVLEVDVPGDGAAGGIVGTQRAEEGELPPDKPSSPNPPPSQPSPAPKHTSTHIDPRPPMRLVVIPSTAPPQLAIPGAVFAFFFLPPKDRTDTSALFPHALLPSLKPPPVEKDTSRSLTPELLSRKEKTLLEAASEPVELMKSIVQGDLVLSEGDEGAAAKTKEEDVQENDKREKEKVKEEDRSLGQGDVEMLELTVMEDGESVHRKVEAVTAGEQPGELEMGDGLLHLEEETQEPRQKTPPPAALAVPSHSYQRSPSFDRHSSVDSVRHPTSASNGFSSLYHSDDGEDGDDSADITAQEISAFIERDLASSALDEEEFKEERAKRSSAKEVDSVPQADGLPIVAPIEEAAPFAIDAPDHPSPAPSVEPAESAPAVEAESRCSPSTPPSAAVPLFPPPRPTLFSTFKPVASADVRRSVHSPPPAQPTLPLDVECRRSPSPPPAEVPHLPPPRRILLSPLPQPPTSLTFRRASPRAAAESEVETLLTRSSRDQAEVPSAERTVIHGLEATIAEVKIEQIEIEVEQEVEVCEVSTGEMEKMTRTIPTPPPQDDPRPPSQATLYEAEDGAALAAAPTPAPPSKSTLLPRPSPDTQPSRVSPSPPPPTPPPREAVSSEEPAKGVSDATAYETAESGGPPSDDGVVFKVIEDVVETVAEEVTGELVSTAVETVVEQAAGEVLGGALGEIAGQAAGDFVSDLLEGTVSTVLGGASSLMEQFLPAGGSNAGGSEAGSSRDAENEAAALELQRIADENEALWQQEADARRKEHAMEVFGPPKGKKPPPLKVKKEKPPRRPAGMDPLSFLAPSPVAPAKPQRQSTSAAIAALRADVAASSPSFYGKPSASSPAPFAGSSKSHAAEKASSRRSKKGQGSSVAGSTTSPARRTTTRSPRARTTSATTASQILPEPSPPAVTSSQPIASISALPAPTEAGAPPPLHRRRSQFIGVEIPVKAKSPKRKKSKQSNDAAPARLSTDLTSSQQLLPADSVRAPSPVELAVSVEPSTMGEPVDAATTTSRVVPSPSPVQSSSLQPSPAPQEPPQHPPPPRSSSHKPSPALVDPVEDLQASVDDHPAAVDLQPPPKNDDSAADDLPRSPSPVEPDYLLPLLDADPAAVFPSPAALTAASLQPRSPSPPADADAEEQEAEPEWVASPAKPARPRSRTYGSRTSASPPKDVPPVPAATASSDPLAGPTPSPQLQNQELPSEEDEYAQEPPKRRRRTLSGGSGKGRQSKKVARVEKEPTPQLRAAGEEVEEEQASVEEQVDEQQTDSDDDEVARTLLRGKGKARAIIPDDEEEEEEEKQQQASPPPPPPRSARKRSASAAAASPAKKVRLDSNPPPNLKPPRRPSLAGKAPPRPSFTRREDASARPTPSATHKARPSLTGALESAVEPPATPSRRRLSSASTRRVNNTPASVSASASRPQRQRKTTDEWWKVERGLEAVEASVSPKKRQRVREEAEMYEQEQVEEEEPPKPSPRKKGKKKVVSITPQTVEEEEEPLPSPKKVKKAKKRKAVSVTPHSDNDDDDDEQQHRHSPSADFVEEDDFDAAPSSNYGADTSFERDDSHEQQQPEEYGGGFDEQDEGGSVAQEEEEEGQPIEEETISEPPAGASTAKGRPGVRKDGKKRKKRKSVVMPRPKYRR